MCLDLYQCWGRAFQSTGIEQWRGSLGEADGADFEAELLVVSTDIVRSNILKNDFSFLLKFDKKFKNLIKNLKIFSKIFKIFNFWNLRQQEVEQSWSLQLQWWSDPSCQSCWHIRPRGRCTVQHPQRWTQRRWRRGSWGLQCRRRWHRSGQRRSSCRCTWFA